MKTVVVGPRPAELEALIAARRARGLDLFDEIWDGVLHMNPAPRVRHGIVAAEVAAALRPAVRRARLRESGPFNLGVADDFRVPDIGYQRDTPDGVWLPTAAIVVEVRSPDDETFDKFGFFFDHGVDELAVADPDARSVQWWLRGSQGFEPTEHSALLDVSVADIVGAIDWP
jgi:Uma2 family endonuclease